MSVSGILGRITALFATVCFAIALLYWFNYLALGGGINAVYIALWGMLLGAVCLMLVAFQRWV